MINYNVFVIIVCRLRSWNEAVGGVGEQNARLAKRRKASVEMDS